MHGTSLVPHRASDCSTVTSQELYIVASCLGFIASISYTGLKEMTEPPAARRYRFGVFEADAATGELRRQGIRIKLNAQPFQVLLALLERPANC